MTPSLEHLQQLLKQLPGLGFRSAERVALHLLLEKPERLPALVEALQDAASTVRRCDRCGNLAEEALCAVCQDDNRDHGVVCVVEQVPDLVALERSGAYRGGYHVLHGKLSPIHGVGPEHLNFTSLGERMRSGEVRELILALSNDVEGEATCHFLTDELMPDDAEIAVSRIGFGLPSGGGVLYADSVTLKSALDGRRTYS
ncbi:recombination mediator RecR [Synoicihabitans lomoniglobus]|uniref:Recombination protein RecR n=1 Tax=Synoicihabitans lomoniglobus TaxID=2909285 RepID=A0AAF0I5F0_9BACT|nr:recombination mediator RecR [Opitutaceae bacterium LMO-M01]WED67318.1 recombination mediator RecR [Opitutaceae bacterium LMO-M01]